MNKEFYLYTNKTKVIIHKSRGELPLVEQVKIEYVSVAYLNSKLNFQEKISFFFLHFMQLFSVVTTRIFKFLKNVFCP